VREEARTETAERRRPTQACGLLVAPTPKKLVDRVDLRIFGARAGPGPGVELGAYRETRSGEMANGGEETKAKE
jgi:hypothetical protein